MGVDLVSQLRRAVQLAREAGLEESARELEERASAAKTSSSEWLGELGEAILRFRSRAAGRIPGEAVRLLDECLAEVGRVWPRYAPGPRPWLKALLGRARSR